MKIITLYNHKGGVGKTTSTGIVAHYLATQGKKVAIFDFDSQGNLTEWLTSQPIEKELKNCIENDIPLEDIKINVKENLDLFPTRAESSLSDIQMTVLLKDPKYFCRKRGNSFLLQLASMNYDYVFWDLAPSLDTLELALLDITDEIMLIVEPEFFSCAGIVAVIQKIQKIKENSDNDNISCDKIILTKLNESIKTHTQLAKELFEELADTFNFFIIPQDSQIKRIQNTGNNTPFDFLQERSKSREAYAEIGNYILSKEK